MSTIYQNNSCEIEVVRVDPWECKVNVNGENLIWISAEQKEDFARELQALLDKYRI